MSVDITIFDEIEQNIERLEIDEIKRRLEPLMLGFQIQSPIFDPGAFVYRARKLGLEFRMDAGITRSDLIYPPASKTMLGRLNRTGEPVFYGAMHKEAVFFEIPGLKAGDELVLSFWKTKERMFVNNIGYTEFAFEQLGAKRPVPDWNQKQEMGSSEQTLAMATLPKEVAERLMSKDDARELKEAFSKYFTRQVDADERNRYKLTAAIGELHLGEIPDQNAKFAGVLYPSVRMFANGDNIGIQPWFVDNHLEFRKAVRIRIKERREAAFDIGYLDAAHDFNEAGNLKWMGRIKNWTLKPKQKAQAVYEPGLDADGDYQISKDGKHAHWVLTDIDTGKTIEPG
ncbi:RES domain-containing protein [Undibacter mobilis]|uniref:Uncharacterized protein n=1 Tax=Undibacter mobilis TaxID=2292256 RepID=A0A371BBZ9_9BRAD|nr:RES domain-containing protein [Undibacter mobilis]RDV05135.1 hypothetical protein DXH78_11510 [Undibacter mobilis]